MLHSEVPSEFCEPLEALEQLEQKRLAHRKLFNAVEHHNGLLVKVPYMYALYVCLICMPYVYGLSR